MTVKGTGFSNDNVNDDISDICLYGILLKTNFGQGKFEIIIN